MVFESGRQATACSGHPGFSREILVVSIQLGRASHVVVARGPIQLTEGCSPPLIGMAAGRPSRANESLSR